MPKKVKEKTNTKHTKDSSLFDLDNEIIIGIKTLPQPEVPKAKKKKANKSQGKNTKKVSNTKATTKKKKAKKQDEFEFKLGIEDETIKNKKKTATKKKKSKKNVKKKTTKQEEIAKKKRKIIFRLIKWTTLILILIGGGIYFLLSPFFNVKQINVSGNTKITSEELISLSGIQLEENIFKVRKNQVEKNIKQNAYVENVKIKRSLPNTIEIEIIERTPTYMISLANAYVYINNQGYFLEVSKESLNLPIIVGYSTEEGEIHIGNRLCTEDLQKLNDVLQIMKSAENNQITELVTKINISNKNDYVLELKSEKKTVHIGDCSNLSTKVLYIRSILDENKDVEGEIFVNTDLNNKGAIFRKKI